MTTSVLIVHWDDLLGPRSGIDLSPTIAVHAARKQARVRHGAETTLVVGSWATGGPEIAEFQRSGYRLHDEAAIAGDPAGALPGEPDDGRRAVLVMAAGRARAWREALAATGWEAEIWRVGEADGFSPEPGERPLSAVVRPTTISSTGLYIDWHHLEVGYRLLSVPPDVPRAGRGLLRRAGLVGDVLDARLYGAWPADEAAALAARLNGGDGPYCPLQLRPQPAGDPPAAGDCFREDLEELLESPEPPRTWILVSHHPGIPALAEAARRRGVRVVLWAAEGEPGRPEARQAVDHYVPLQSVLDLRAHNVALYIDYENIARSLVKNGFHVDPATLARGLIERARSFGRVAEARAYADWDQFLEHREPDGRIVRRGAQRAFREAGIDTVYVLPGPNSADVQLARDLETLAGSEESPDTFLLASGDGDFCAMVDGIRRRGREAWVWSVRSATRSQLLSRATRHEWIEDFLNLGAAPPRGLTASRVSIVTREWDDPALGSAPDAATGSRLSLWVRMLYQIERYLRANQWSKAAFRRLAGHLGTLEEFGPTPANAMMWLNRAKAEGMLLVDQEAHRGDRAIRITTCRLNPEHPAARAASEVPERVLRLLYQMLQKMPWVSFKLLRNVLLREQWLGGPPHHLDESAVDEWINYLVADCAIAMSKEPNAENPEYPVTALRLDDEHPLTRAVVHQAMVGTRLAAERVILAVDHFLVRSRKPWMAMSALRRVLEGIGREELQEVLKGLQNLGALLTESYPNPQKEHFTTGCSLNADVPVVRETLHVRDAVIQTTQYLQRHRSWVPLAKLDEELAARVWGAVQPNQRLAWFSLLRDEAVLELDHEGPLPPGVWGSIHCRLKVTDAVVRAVIAQNPSPPEWGSAGRPAVPADEESDLAARGLAAEWAVRPAMPARTSTDAPSPP
jgi:uncharacterized LabA/DUF88 family protein